MVLPSCRALKLVTMNHEITRMDRKPQDAEINSKEDLLKVYSDRFTGIDNFEGEFHVTTAQNVTPVVHAPRKCQIHRRDEIKSELDEMQSMGSSKKSPSRLIGCPASCIVESHRES